LPMFRQGRYKYRSGVRKLEKPQTSIFVRLPVTSLEVYLRQSARDFQ
jgi:hypothetical protein